jgi:hypothetical protein
MANRQANTDMMQIDVDLDRTEWETLRNLGAPEPDHHSLDGQAFERLVASELVAVRDGRAVITPLGRKVIVRGSPRLWDLSA